MDFETLWDTHERKVANKMKFNKTLRKTALFSIIGVLILSMGGFAANQMIQKDNVDYPFVDDPQLIGEWESVDFVRSPEDFNVDSHFWGEDLTIKKFAFLSEGKMMIVDSTSNGNMVPSGYTYTKDHILHRSAKTDSAYVIKTIGTDQYLFMQWKAGDYRFQFKKPSYYVFKQISNQEVSDTKPKSVRNDDVNLTFESDPLALGKWHTVDFVESPEQFNPDIRANQEEDFLQSVEMRPDGLVAYSVTNGVESGTDFDHWTKGKIYVPSVKCVEPYSIKEINGKTYLFFPWINGDVVYRGNSASYYVLEKE